MDASEIINRRIKRIAKENRCSVLEVDRALDAHPVLRQREKYLSRLLALELIELDGLGEVFRAKAIEGDVAAGALLTKIFERRATLLGLNAAASSAVVLIENERPRETSTDRVRSAIDRIRGLPRPPPDEAA